MQPLILRDLCKKGSCDPPPPPPHTGHCGHTKVALYRGPVYRAGQGIKRSHHKPTVWSSLSIPWHCLGNLGLRTIFIKCNIFILSTRFAISATTFCNWSGKSPQPLLATVLTKPHLWLMMYLSCFCSTRQHRVMEKQVADRHRAKR